jgi:hypothetical protein
MTQPEPFVQGTFAVFETPDGGVVLVTRIAGGPEQQHHVPGPLVAVAKRMAAGEGLSPATMLRALGGARGGRKALRGAPVDPPGILSGSEGRTEP